MKLSKIAIIGSGFVGSTVAYALMLKNIIAEIILVDIDKIRCRGEVLDLSDSLSFSKTSILRKGSPQDAQLADIIIIAAGKKQKLGQGRLTIVQTNQKIIASIINNIKPIQENTIILIVTNPVDILTYHAQKISGLNKNQVFGSGTYLDTQRLRGLISKKIGIAQQSINAYILGEHGDSQVPIWSTAHINGTLIKNFPGIQPDDLKSMAKETCYRAYKIIECKKSTYYGIASCVSDICETILFDKKQIFPLSCYIQQYKTCLSMPVVLGAYGIESILPVQLNQLEQNQLKKSAQKLKKIIDKINKQVE